jgi:hypothetical protein
LVLAVQAERLDKITVCKALVLYLALSLLQAVVLVLIQARVGALV